MNTKKILKRILGVILSIIIAAILFGLCYAQYIANGGTSIIEFSKIFVFTIIGTAIFFGLVWLAVDCFID